MATSNDVARLAGVSRSTVSRTLSDSPRVNEATKARVRKAVAALGYEPDLAARSLVNQRSRTIALAFGGGSWPFSDLSGLNNLFYLSVLREIERAAAEHEFDLLLPPEPGGPSGTGYLRRLRAHKAAGVILRARPHDPRAIALIDAGEPVVLIDSGGVEDRCTQVRSDNTAATHQLTEHLISLGHRRIAVIAGPLDDPMCIDRLAGVRQALARAAIPEDPDLIKVADWSIEGGYSVVRQLLHDGVDFTAVAAQSDIMAIGAMRALDEQGRRVPDDVSVCGFDDLEFAAFTNPPLTTARQDAAGMGRTALTALVARIENPDARPEAIVLPVRLVVRASTGPASRV